MKRCCETCRFFDKGTLAGSGWCRHPERVEATSDLVLVRASQLTCRKGWDKDYWEPMARSSRSIDHIARGGQLGPVPPASPEDIDAIINAGRNSDGDRTAALVPVEEDRVVGASPSPLTHVPKSLISKHLPPTPEPSKPNAGVVGSPNTREKILIAKEEVARKRISNRIRPAVEPIPSPVGPPASASKVSVSGIEPPASIGAEPDHIREEDTEPVANDNTGRPGVSQPNSGDDKLVLPFDLLQSSKEWDDEPLVPTIPPTFDHWNYPPDRHPPFLWLVPKVDGKRAHDAIQGQPDTALSPPLRVDDVVAQDINELPIAPFELPPPVDETFLPPSSPTRQKPRSRKQRQSFTFRTRWSEPRERPRRREVDPSPVWVDAPGREDGSEWLQEVEPTAERYSSAAVLPVLDELAGDPQVAQTDEPSGQRMTSGHPTGWTGEDALVGTTSATHSQSFESAVAEVDLEIHHPPVIWDGHETALDRKRDDVVVGGNGHGPIVYDPEIDDYILAPDVPRMCRTCGAFRPAEDGERGWCSNGWAFNNRLLVSAWDVPCQTSFGNWWIPNDDHWNDGTYNRLHAPAPLFDLLMAQRTPPRREKPQARKRWS